MVYKKFKNMDKFCNSRPFPITYNTQKITQELFLIAVEKLTRKFKITKDRAIELAEDIIKAMITENKSASDLALEIDELSYSGWEFLRENSIREVIEKNKSVL